MSRGARMSSDESISPGRDRIFSLGSLTANQSRVQNRQSLPATHGRRTFNLSRSGSDKNPFDKPKPEVLITQEDDDDMLLEDLKPVDEKFQRTLNVASLR